MTDQQAGDFAEIRSVGRGLGLLEIMQRAAPAGIRVCEPQPILGVDPATASRLLSTLITRGYASRMPNRRYTLGARSLRLASGWIDRLLQVAAPPMARIANSCGETVYLIQLVGTEAVTLARVDRRRRAMIEGRNRAKLSALGDRRGTGVTWQPAAASRTCAAAGGAVPFVHAANKDDVGRCQRGHPGRPPRRYPCRRGRDRSVSELLRHAIAA